MSCFLLFQIYSNGKTAGAKRDEDGYIWVTGRVDDLINVSGHLLSTAEIESALVSYVCSSGKRHRGRPEMN